MELPPPVHAPPPEPHAPPAEARRRTRVVLLTLLVGAGVVAAGLGAALALLARDGAPAPASAAAPVATVPPGARPLAAAGGPVPETLPTEPLEGFAGAPPVDLAAYRGRPLVVNLWATWCAPCVKEMPDFQAVHAALGDRVAFLGVDVQDGPARAEPFVAELGITYDLAADPQLAFTEAVGAIGMPTTLFVDPDGRIVHRVTGPMDQDALRAALEQHLGVGA